MKSSNIGGQAVMEGIMMKHKSAYSIAVRKPNQEIEVRIDAYQGLIKNSNIQKIPILRGIVNFIDSMILGTKSLMFSAEFVEDDEPKEEKSKSILSYEEERKKQIKDEKLNNLLMGGTVIFSILLSIAIFIMLPYFLANFLRAVTQSELLISVAEAVARILIFLIYMVLISQMKDIQRVFMYHGAEHKCINCIENGMDLTVENVMKSTRLHKRCGTSFLLIVMVVSVVFFLFIRVQNPWLRVVVRLCLVPVIAGVSYEFIRLAGKSNHKFVSLLSKPGMALQKLTTREPDEDMVEVAIKAVEAVFDWKEFLYSNQELDNETTNSKEVLEL